jgi:hypothetical protein
MDARLSRRILHRMQTQRRLMTKKLTPAKSNVGAGTPNACLCVFIFTETRTMNIVERLRLRSPVCACVNVSVCICVCTYPAHLPRIVTMFVRKTVQRPYDSVWIPVCPNYDLDPVSRNISLVVQWFRSVTLAFSEIP